MSASEYNLSVAAGDELAEISIIDARLNPVAKGVGRLDAAVPGGIYKVLVRVGSHLDEQLVAVDHDRTLSFAAPGIPSPIPFMGSSLSHEYHEEAAVKAASEVRDKFGEGGSILIFAREYTADGSGSKDNPGGGLYVLDNDGNELASIEDRADFRATPDPSAGWRGDVAPGSYRLRLKLPDGTATERAIYVAPNTQTQIFLLQRDYRLSDGETIKRRADLGGGTVATSTHFGFDPLDVRVRLSELASYALAQTRHVLSDSLLERLLNEKFDDPMLGLLGAHLILRDHPKDARLYRIVTDNLLRLVGPEHPDLRALWLRREDRSGIKNHQIDVPPMLRRSWEIATEESVRNPDVIPPGSPSSAVIFHVIPAVPWLVWRAQAAAAALESVASELPPTAKALADLITSRAQSEAARAERVPGAVRGAVRGAMPASTPTLTPEDKAEIARVLGVSGPAIDETLRRLFR
jgi:hypothetical protein